MELKLFEGMLQKDKDEFKRICNKLLSTCFICKRNESSKSDFYFVVRYKETFSQYISVLGFQLDINEEYGVVQLVNNQNYNRLNLKLYESIIMLIIRILYDEKKRELSSIDEVIINVGDIQEKYLALKIRDKLIDKTTMGNALKLFRRMQIVDTIDKDLTKEESRIMIFDSILMAVRVEDIKQVFDKITIYKKGDKTDEETDQNEID